MTAYVPPHLRKLKKEVRQKTLIIPIINNKYVVTKYKAKNELTFMGGGCGLKNTSIKNCAHRELREESRHSIQNKNLKNLFVFQVNDRYRSNKERADNLKRGLKVFSNYHVFSVSPKNSINSIRKHFHTYIPRTKAENEMSNIMLKSLNNLNRNKTVWVLIRNQVLPRLRRW